MFPSVAYADRGQEYRPPLPADRDSCLAFPVVPAEHALCGVATVASRFRGDDFKVYFAHPEQRPAIAMFGGGVVARGATTPPTAWCRDSLVDGTAVVFHYRYNHQTGWLDAVPAPLDQVCDEGTSFGSGAAMWMAQQEQVCVLVVSAPVVWHCRQLWEGR